MKIAILNIMKEADFNPTIVQVENRDWKTISNAKFKSIEWKEFLSQCIVKGLKFLVYLKIKVFNFYVYL